MMKFKISLILFLVSLVSFSQTKEDALRDAKITAKATLNSDFNTVFKYTLPSVIDLMGGKENALNVVKSSFDDMKKQGFVFEKADVVSVSEVVSEDGQFRCFIENNNVMVMDNMRIKSKSYLLGIYNEKDKSWWFIEADKLKNKAIADQILPNFKTSLKIPKDEVKFEKL